ncbi:MAG TPA: hypothetical protein VIK86_03535 [Candidatus Paceibacterota bacterium]
MEEIKSRICKDCGEEKPISEFNKAKSHGAYSYLRCKVCDYLKRNKPLIINNWTIFEYRIILDKLLNKKVKTLNEIKKLLDNKTLDNLCRLLKDNLKIGGKIPIKIEKICSECGNIFYVKLYQYFTNGNNFCSHKCNGTYNGKIKTQNKKEFEKICQYCGKIFYVSLSRVNKGKDKFCSAKCSQLSQKREIKYNCDLCGKEFITNPSKIKQTKNHFCSVKCADTFRSEQAHEIRKCEICGKEFECLKSCTQKMCSIQCQGKWQSQNLIGENANGYNKNISIEQRTLICICCGKEFLVNPFKIESAKCCSNECRQKWYAEVISQTDEWRKTAQIRAVNMLENGTFGRTDTEAQRELNSILDKINVKYINEKAFNYCAVDNYLPEHNLIVECQGTYWHTDNRFYSTINYSMQVNRIRMDKIKHINIKKDHNIEILYLWEYDILNNPELCSQLVLEYILNKGILKNYHSFNYTYTNSLISNENLIKPYMEWDIEDLKIIINTTVKEKMSRKQLDKWITFNCECCGNEKEELISHYNRHEHHYCSIKCSAIMQNKKVLTNCDCCNSEVEIIPSKLKRDNWVFCSQECRLKYRKEFGFKKVDVKKTAC